MVNVNQEIIRTNTIENRYDMYEMVLQPQSFTLRNRFRDNVHNRIHLGNDQLPSMTHTVINGERIDFIDESTITKMNTIIPSEERTELMRSIINFTRSDEIRMMLIENSSKEIKEKLKDLLIRCSNSDISYYELLTLGNIIVYTMSGIPEASTIREVVDVLRNSMFDYDRNQIMDFILQRAPEVSRQLEEANLATESLANENNDRIDQRIFLNRQYMFRIGGGVLTSMAVMYAGAPYLAPLIVLTRSVPSGSITTTALVPSSNGFGASVDVLSWKEILQEISKKAREFLTGCL